MMRKYIFCNASHYTSTDTFPISYSPILRPLRMVAQCVVFNKVPSMSISKRLQTICELEGLETDLRALNMLTDLTDGDIRSCLNTLQVKKKKRKKRTIRKMN